MRGRKYMEGARYITFLPHPFCVLPALSWIYFTLGSLEATPFLFASPCPIARWQDMR